MGWLSRDKLQQKHPTSLSSPKLGICRENLNANETRAGGGVGDSELQGPSRSAGRNKQGVTSGSSAPKSSLS